MPGLLTLGIRNLSRRPGRSLAVIGIIACSAFVIIALESQRLNALGDTSNRTSGTGGFALIGETTHSVFADLNSDGGREKFGLNRPEFSNVDFVPVRILEGDDASCLNLNRAQRPRFIGINPNSFISRGAFSFTDYENTGKISNPWELLTHDFGDHVIPAIADSTTITYALGKKLGDFLTTLDGHGNQVRIRLVGALKNSILQGNLVVDESVLKTYFPAVSGYRMFLIDAPSKNLLAIQGELHKSLQDVGLELVTAVTRLNEFNQVQNTYISIFQLLGGLGMILGSFGLGVLLLRNVLERRPEFALMKALGFRGKSIQLMLLSEHWFLLILGSLCGVCAALLAIYPRFVNIKGQLPWLSLAITVGGMLFNGLLWTWVAAKFAMKQPLITALRKE